MANQRIKGQRIHSHDFDSEHLHQPTESPYRPRKKKGKGTMELVELPPTQGGENRGRMPHTPRSRSNNRSHKHNINNIRNGPNHHNIPVTPKKRTCVPYAIFAAFAVLVTMLIFFLKTRNTEEKLLISLFESD